MMEKVIDDRDPLTHQVIGAALEVHKEMGPGLLESIYQKCLESELKRQGIQFQAQTRLPLEYKNVLLEDYLVIDIYFPNQLIVELKAVEKLLPVHEAQLLSYLRLSKTPVGLIINFNVPLLKEGIKRMVI